LKKTFVIPAQIGILCMYSVTAHMTHRKSKLTSRLPFKPFPVQRVAVEAGRRRGFTLVEMLVVIAIMVVLFSAGIPAVENLGASRGISSATSQISGALELAKSTAVARNTYVWVGFANVGPNSDRNGETCIGIMMSKDGTKSSLLANLAPVGKLVAIENVALAEPSELPSALRSRLPDEIKTETSTNKYVVNLNNNLANYTFKKSNLASGTTVTFKDDFILISPQGEVVANADSDSFVPQTMIGLTQSRQNKSLGAASKDGAVVVFHGGTGQIQVLR
jgi:prepilin-type N-terminal cleavage/methylation domain-containing protein